MFQVSDVKYGKHYFDQPQTLVIGIPKRFKIQLFRFDKLNILNTRI